jgi:hypothetical protein
MRERLSEIKAEIERLQTERSEIRLKALAQGPHANGFKSLNYLIYEDGLNPGDIIELQVDQVDSDPGAIQCAAVLDHNFDPVWLEHNVLVRKKGQKNA